MKKKLINESKLGGQRHAGTFKDNHVFHTNSDGTWWSGYMFESLTPMQLYRIAASIQSDLLSIYPDLLQDK